MSRSYNQKLTVEKEIETTPFTPETLAGDLAQLQSILIDFFDGVSSADWDRPTERQGTGWTLRQTLAHVTAVAEVFQKALEDTLAGIPHVYPGLTSRADLPAVLERDIAAREHIPPDTLIQTLLETLAQTTDHTTPLTSDQLALPVDIRAYNRPLTVAELIGVQIVHLGVVHAAQLANAVEAKPLWIHYSAGLMQRQMTRFFGMVQNPGKLVLH
ncbi:MAG: maleylpyruvate isomerase family protein [Ketobacter sp.]|nr:maleylpyruvate isomerase family protein [Ketobacter sp.]